MALGKIVRWTVIVLVLAQAIRPNRTNPPVDPSRTIQAARIATPEVSAILNRSCKDCHSNTTEWPWYSNVAPASWLLVSHVRDGREHLNFSESTTYDAETTAKKLKSICEQVSEGEMPMTSYALVHETARLSEDDKEVLCAWTEKMK
jgi:hypothetical protein